MEKSNSEYLKLLKSHVIIMRSLDLILTVLFDQLHLFTFVGSENKIDPPDLESLRFKFLINNELVEESLEAHIQSRDLPTENVIHIQYAERSPPPSLSEELDHPDWVSCAHCNRQL